MMLDKTKIIIVAALIAILVLVAVIMLSKKKTNGNVVKTTLAKLKQALTTTRAPTQAPINTRAPTQAPINTRAPTQARITTRGPTQAPINTRAPTQARITTRAPTQAPITTRAPTQAVVNTSASNPSGSSTNVPDTQLSQPADIITSYATGTPPAGLYYVYYQPSNSYLNTNTWTFQSQPANATAIYLDPNTMLMESANQQPITFSDGNSIYVGWAGGNSYPPNYGVTDIILFVDGKVGTAWQFNNNQLEGPYVYGPGPNTEYNFALVPATA